MIRLAAQAASGLQDVAERIQVSKGPAAANRIIDQILSSIRRLESFPTLGHSGRVSDTRDLPVAGLPFIVIHQSYAEMIAMYRIINGAMQWPSEPPLGMMFIPAPARLP